MLFGVGLTLISLLASLTLLSDTTNSVAIYRNYDGFGANSSASISA